MYIFKHLKATYASLKSTEKLVARFTNQSTGSSTELFENGRQQYLVAILHGKEIISVRRYEIKPKFWDNAIFEFSKNNLKKL